MAPERSLAKLVPELICSDLARSLRFYTEVAGFRVLYERPEERFAFLDRDGAQLMLEEPVGRVFLAAQLFHPYGRGMNLQIQVEDVGALHARIASSGARIHLALEEKWYRREDAELGNRQFVVEDPDGYLLRFFQDLGTRGLEAR